MNHLANMFLAALVVFAGMAAPSAQVTLTSTHAKTYKNCTELNKHYKHGVGRRTAHDVTSGRPVTTFTRDDAGYAANRRSDRDRDGIACEKR